MFGRHTKIGSWLLGVAAALIALAGVVGLTTVSGGPSTAVSDAGIRIERTRPLAQRTGLANLPVDDLPESGGNGTTAIAAPGGATAGTATNTSSVEADPGPAAAASSGTAGAGGRAAGGGQVSGGGGTNPGTRTGSKTNAAAGNADAGSAPASPPPTSPPPPSGPALDNGCEQQAFDRMNISRNAAGVRTLLPGAQGDDVPDAWSGHMAGTQRLEHNPSYQSQLDSQGVDWRTAGENVGTNHDLSDLHEDWMNSSVHRNNVTNSGFTHAAVGCSQDSSGAYWVTVDFWSV